MSKMAAIPAPPLDFLSPPISHLDPQSPFPCTPSTLGGSSPLAGAEGQYFSSLHNGHHSIVFSAALGGTNDARGSPSRHQVHSSHLSGLHQAAAAPTSLGHRQGAGDTSQLGHGKSRSPLANAASDIELARSGSVGTISSSPTSTLASSPRIPHSISSPSMPGSVDVSPEHDLSSSLRRHCQSSSFSTLGGASSQMRSHASAASIPIILAGLGMRESMARVQESPPSRNIVGASASGRSMRSTGDSDAAWKNGHGLGLGILDAPIELRAEKALDAGGKVARASWHGNVRKSGC